MVKLFTRRLVQWPNKALCCTVAVQSNILKEFLIKSHTIYRKSLTEIILLPTIYLLHLEREGGRGGGKRDAGTFWPVAGGEEGGIFTNLEYQ